MTTDDQLWRLLNELDPATKDRLLTEAIAQRTRTRVATAVGPDVAKTAEELRKKYAEYTAPQVLRPGQFVTWKTGLKNKKRPEEGEPAIVVEVLDKPFFDEEQGPGSAYYRERLDIVLGVLNEDGGFLLFHFDSRRFRLIDVT